MNDALLIEKEQKLAEEWYAAQTTTHLRALKAGAWDANDRDRWCSIRAELDRRDKGGTFRDHYRHDWR